MFFRDRFRDLLQESGKRAGFCLRWGPAMWGLFVLTVAVGCTRSAAVQVGEVYAVGVREPNAIPATDAKISDDRLVIGVSVGNRHRAYLLRSFAMPEEFDIETATAAEAQELKRHIVNDLIDGVPITVSHCDDNFFTRVFVGDGDESLRLAVCGRRDGEMDLDLDGERFLQNATDAPLKTHPFRIIEWGRWRTEHPETDIYVGTND